MIKSNCFIIANNIYIITGCERGESLNKYGNRFKWYYIIKNMTTGNRKKVTEEYIKKMSEKYKIEWQKSEVDMRNIKIVNK